MGILKNLKNVNSNLSKYNGGSIPTNPLATKQSKLHVFQSKPGYGLNGGFSTDVIKAFNQYNDGVVNNLPTPSTLDINGVKPKSSLRDSNFQSINNTFSKGTYRNNLPEGRSF